MSAIVIILPNPLDMGLFNKILFLYRDPSGPSVAEVSFAGKITHTFTVGWDGEQIKFFDL